MKVRVSYGTAIAMGLIKAKLLARPTTAYLMTYYEGKCLNDCKFCPQARSSRASADKLSRVTWPAFDLSQVVENIAEVYERGGIVSLFAFTPIKGTPLENHASPPVKRYRRIQWAHYLIKTGKATLEDFEFDEDGNLVGFPRDIVNPMAFVTQGCPWCNRPYYNERPGKEPYNFPSSEMVELENIKRELF
ncbi:hypothetical protein A3L04_01830 [Thermococcus chitonophagus]|uniref:Biotin synthase-related protein, radical SAM superfamily n=1 Tax=Thermococcus chitonophagus TaxID=54262 RepID=A0A160VU26_9EURY|nr:hypothetical protein [Thermococcus chitonophagus]ASJ15899.1 hypothetical protein A3L04_01830 [Thermococcus chitonophagus]CUX77141.1 Biotin synthase-related protein, radical SAM superfamily [Thermococcus chitonophagus]